MHRRLVVILLLSSFKNMWSTLPIHLSQSAIPDRLLELLVRHQKAAILAEAHMWKNMEMARAEGSSPALLEDYLLKKANIIVKLMDKDKDGFITSAEASGVLRLETIHEEEWEQMWTHITRTADQDADNQVSNEECAIFLKDLWARFFTQENYDNYFSVLQAKARAC